MKIEMEAIGKFTSVILIIVFASIIGGLVFVKFWEWFVLTSFDLPHLSLIQAIGLSFFISYVKSTKKDDNKDGLNKIFEKVAFSTIYTGVLFLIGYIIHLCY